MTAASALSVDDAGAVLAVIDRGALDTILTDDARARLRVAAEVAVAAVAGIGVPDVIENTDPAPLARVVKVRPATRRAGRTVEVSCPWCRTRGGKPRTHTHGWPAGDAEPGLRIAHCGARGEYRIVLGEFA